MTRPYTSQDKGTVENRIEVIRRFYTQKTDLAAVTNREIKAVQEKINNRPIRKFRYKSANQIFSEKLQVSLEPRKYYFPLNHEFVRESIFITH